MRRQLDDTEKKLNTNAIERIKNENIELDYILRESKLILEEGLDYSLNKQKKQYNALIKKQTGYLKRYSEIKLEGLDINYRKQKKQYTQLIKEAIDTIHLNDQKIKILLDQNENGVEVKENKLV